MSPSRLPPSGRTEAVGAFLDEAFRRYHRPALIQPDPLQFLAGYPNLGDRELAALLASGLAYGQVQGILRSVRRVLEALGPQPTVTVDRNSDAELARRLAGFQHRWTRANEVVVLLRVARDAQKRWGTLGERLAGLVSPGDGDLHPALQRWVGELHGFGLPARHSLLADPNRGSACKRLYLMARWLVRQDEVDPGGWTGLSPALLLVPIDVHMHRIARALGFTRRRAADLRTVREITNGFRRYAPGDPVRFDFALTRLPIHDRLTPGAIGSLIRSGFPPNEE